MSERGVSESTQWALLIPVVMLVVLGTIQAGIWLHARTVASQAAGAAAEQIAWSRSSSREACRGGRRAARCGRPLDPAVQIDRSGGNVRVTVIGRPALIVDLGLGAVTEHVLMPLERVVR